jgi:hypothetical protein
MRVPDHPTLIRRMLNKRLKQLASDKPILAASLVECYRICGKAGCHCAHGDKHRVHQITFKAAGQKSRSVYVPVDLTEEVRSWIDEHRRIKQVLAEISQLTLALVRGHAAHKKRQRGRS